MKNVRRKSKRETSRKRTRGREKREEGGMMNNGRLGSRKDMN